MGLFIGLCGLVLLVSGFVLYRAGTLGYTLKVDNDHEINLEHTGLIVVRRVEPAAGEFRVIASPADQSNNPAKDIGLTIPSKRVIPLSQLAKARGIILYAPAFLVIDQELYLARPDEIIRNADQREVIKPRARIMLLSEYHIWRRNQAMFGLIGCGLGMAGLIGALIVTYVGVGGGP